MKSSSVQALVRKGCEAPIKIACLVALLSLALLETGCASKPYVPKANEEICGTWTSKTASCHKIIMRPDGTWEVFIYESDVLPVTKGIYQIVEKWKDSEGNTWYKEIITITVGSGKGESLQELDRIDKTGRVWEYDWNQMTPRYDPSNFPQQIDPEAYNYHIYQRLE